MTAAASGIVNFYRPGCPIKLNYVSIPVIKISNAIGDMDLKCVTAPVRKIVTRSVT